MARVLVTKFTMTHPNNLVQLCISLLCQLFLLLVQLLCTEVSTAEAPSYIPSHSRGLIIYPLTQQRPHHISPHTAEASSYIPSHSRGLIIYPLTQQRPHHISPHTAEASSYIPSHSRGPIIYPLTQQRPHHISPHTAEAPS